FAADGVARSAEDGGTEGSGVSGSEPGATEPADPGDPGVVLPEPGDPDAPATDEPIEELPIEEPVEEPTPEVVTVTLDRAEATLLMLWDVDGNAWLVPGYAFENPEGDFWTTIVSLVEG